MPLSPNIDLLPKKRVINARNEIADIVANIVFPYGDLKIASLFSPMFSNVAIFPNSQL